MRITDEKYYFEGIVKEMGFVLNLIPPSALNFFTLVDKTRSVNAT